MRRLDSHALKLTVVLVASQDAESRWRAEDRENANADTGVATLFARPGELGAVLDEISDLLASDKRENSCAKVVARAREDGLAYSQTVLRQNCGRPPNDRTK